MVVMAFLLQLFILGTYSEWANGQASDVTPDSAFKQPNISCIFHAKRKLICNVVLDDDLKDFTCSVCPHFRKRKLNNATSTCPASYTDSGCPKSQGRCVYNCVDNGYCREGHMVRITRTPDSLLHKPTTTCTLVDTKKYIQPGPVRDLSLIPLNATTVKVKWKKPADWDNKRDFYRYAVLCEQEYSYTNITVRTSRKEIESHCSFLETERMFTVIVKAKPLKYGYWSQPRTATVYNTVESLVSSDESSHLRHFYDPVKSVLHQSGYRTGTQRTRMTENSRGNSENNDNSLKAMVTATLVLVGFVCTILLCAGVVFLSKRRRMIVSTVDPSTALEHYNLLVNVHGVVTEEHNRGK